jgi:hypothetical protein
MRLTLVTLVLVGLVVGALPIADACADGPYRGRVIDAETKEPLAGAVVLVYWIRNAPGIGHGPAQSFLGAEEALTDDRGEFIVGENPPSNWIPFTWRSLPKFIIFQPGYGYFPRHFATMPPLPPTGFEGLLKIMEERPVVFELPRLTSREELVDALYLLPPRTIPPDKIPKLTRLLNVEARQLGLSPRPEEKSK